MELSKQKHIEIQAKLPQITEIQRRLLLPVDILAMKIGPYKNTESAIVCLRDASTVATEAVYALSQAYIHLFWYREEHPDAPLEKEACAYCKFYIDDVALRLYAAAEHLANFVIAFLNIEKSKLKQSKTKKPSSLASRVGKYMFAEMPTHDIIVRIKKLKDDKNWEETMKYRNDWVHEQPPLVDGLGIVYKRKSRWKKADNRVGLFGGSDHPQLSIDSLLNTVSSASHAFVNLLSELSDILFAHLRDLGIDFDQNTGKPKFNL